MRSGLAWMRSVLIAAIMLGGGAGTAAAQAALDDDDDSSEAPASTGDEVADPNATKIGVGFAIRNVWVPQGLIELFVEKAAGGSSEVGFRGEVARRKGDFEVQFGLEYERIDIEDGLWIDKGDNLPADEPDFVEFEDFGWVTAEVTFLNHTEITKQFAIRYGGGAGIALVLGDVVRTDYRCAGTNESPDPCTQSPTAENIREPYDIPPVMLIVNAIIGVQIRPVDQVFINIEGGLRTVPFFGGTVGYYF